MAENDSRRVRYTKNALRSALVDLLQEKPIEKISVSEICRAADVHRNTFYTHYATPEELMEDLVAQNKGDSCNCVVLGDDAFERMAERYREIIESDFLESAHLRGSYHLLEGAFQEGFQKNYEGLRQACPQASEEVCKYLATAINFGSRAMVTQWVQEGHKETPEELSAIVCALGEAVIEAAKRIAERQ